MLATFVKGSLVFILLAAGMFFLLVGVGVTLPVVKYHGLTVRDVPAGVVLLAAGIALAKLWKVTHTKTVEEQITETTKDGEKTIERRTTTVVSTLTKPPI